MRAVIQRVVQASVSVGDELVSSVGRGLCVLVGISRDDTKKDMEYLVRKILNLRIFEDDQGKKWNKSVTDKEYEILCVSQFTLYCTLKGNKPDYHLSMGAESSEAFYNEFLDQMKKAYHPDRIKDGRFGAMMQVNIQNDGPVTITLDSPAQDKGGADNNKKGKQDAKQPTKQASKPDSSSSTASSSQAGATSNDTTDSSLAKDTQDKLNVS